MTKDELKKLKNDLRSQMGNINYRLREIRLLFKFDSPKKEIKTKFDVLVKELDTLNLSMKKLKDTHH